jgi:adenylosuccinate lyase
MRDLGLTYEPAATQVVGRDRYTELVCLLANIATSLERYCTEIRNLQRSEIGEALEPFDAENQIGSSTMPQKRNPVGSENVTGLARIVRGFVIPTFENQVLWHERDLSNSSAERFTLPHVFILLDEMLLRTGRIFSGLEINAERMLKNIASSKGLAMAEPVMMKLTEKGMGRQIAHEIVRTASMNAIERGIGLKEALMERDDIRSILTEKELDHAMDPANYIGGAKEIVDKMVSAAEEALGRKV